MSVRIAVKGTSGSGKTTLARTLAQRFGVPHVELDALHHGPNWQDASADELRRRVQAALDDTRGWVVDGNCDGKLGDLVIDRAELIVWLDRPLALKLLRLLRRTARRLLTREELWNGNRERLHHHLSWDPEALFPWTVRQHFKHRRHWPERFRSRHHVRLRSSADVAAWLSSAAPAAPPPQRAEP